jgi:hypothetical protein
MITIKIAGIVQKYKQVLLFSMKNRELCKNNYLTFYDMPNNCDWNGGRVNRDIEITEAMLKGMDNNGWGFFLGFTNNVILDVQDEVGNKLLEMVSKYDNNGVILQSEALRRYIRQNYKNLKLIYSITGHPTSDHLDFEAYYKEIESKYDLIVPKYSHLDKVLGLLEEGKLDPSKYEILINDNCNATCTMYKEHFDQINTLNRQFTTPWEDNHALAEQIEIKPKTKKSIKNAHCIQDDIPYDFLQRFANTGVTHFKVSGRDLEEYEFDYRLKTHLTTLGGLV